MTKIEELKDALAAATRGEIIPLYRAILAAAPTTQENKKP